MPKLTEGTYALGGLTLLCLWLFFGLPFLYLPRCAAEPLSTVEMVVTPPNAAQKAAQEEEDRQEKRSADRWLVIWTATVAIATIGLILATCWLGYFAYRQARDMKDIIKVVQGNANTAREQVEITKMRVIDLERAYLAVGPTKITVDRGPQSGSDLYVPRSPLGVTVRLFVQNAGRTGATITKVYGEFSRSPPVGDSPVYENGESQITDLSIPASKEEVLSPIVFKDGYSGQQFFWGYLEYADIFKEIHTSRFCAAIFPREGSDGQIQIAGEDGWRYCD
jgi:hypothetical protein